MGYCYFKGVTEFGLFIWPVWGNEFPKAFKIEYSLEELEKNWKNILLRRYYLVEALSYGKYPVMDFHEEWECGYCENNIPGRCFGVRASIRERKRK